MSAKTSRQRRLGLARLRGYLDSCSLALACAKHYLHNRWRRAGLVQVKHLHMPSRRSCTSSTITLAPLPSLRTVHMLTTANGAGLGGPNMGKTGIDRDDDAASSGSDGVQQGLTNRYRVHFPLNDAGGHNPIQEARDVTVKYSSRCEHKPNSFVSISRER